MDFHLLRSLRGGAIYFLYYTGCCNSLSSRLWFSVPALPARHPTGSQVTPGLRMPGWRKTARWFRGPFPAPAKRPSRSPVPPRGMRQRLENTPLGQQRYRTGREGAKSKRNGSGKAEGQTYPAGVPSHRRKHSTEWPSRTGARPCSRA